MTLEELEDNEDEFGEEDEAAIEMYRWAGIVRWHVRSNRHTLYFIVKVNQSTGFQMSPNWT